MRRVRAWACWALIGMGCAGGSGAVPGIVLEDAGSGRPDGSAPPVPTGSTTTAPTTTTTTTSEPDSAPPPPPVLVEPDALTETDVTTEVRIADERKPISPLIYGINANMPANQAPDDVLAVVTWVRRGGDRANAYNWENNISSSSIEGGFINDEFLTEGFTTDRTLPGAVDLVMLEKNAAGGRATMVPFVLNGWVATKAANSINWDAPGGWNRDGLFDRVEVLKPSALSLTPNLTDNVVYTDEHLAFLKARAPTASLMVGIDNEPDLYAYNFPMLQDGAGEALYAGNGVKVGNRLTPTQFIDRFLTFAKRAKELAPEAPIVGPSHYHYDGFTSWHSDSLAEYSTAANAHWFMDDFLSRTKTASEAAGKRLLDTWDFHWYPQHIVPGGKFVWELDHSEDPLSDGEVQRVLQDVRSYWDPDYDEDSWITRDHLFEGTRILTRVRDRIDRAYPGTKLGVSEYFPGGCAHIASGLAVTDTLGVFARMDVHLAAMWPTCARLEYAWGALKLMTAHFDKTSVKVEHPEKEPSSVYAASNSTGHVSVVVINKTKTTRKVGVRIHGAEKLTRYVVHRIDADHPNPHETAAESLAKTNAVVYEAAPLSAAVLTFTRD